MSAPVKILDLYLVRHGESMGNIGKDDNYNDDRKFDPPLSPRGERQAQLLGEYFSALPLDFIFSSGLRRSVHTAQEVALHQPENGAKQVEVHKVFTECNTGEETVGRTIDEIKKDFPLAVSALGTDETEKVVFHGKDDTDEQLLSRAKEGMDYILNRFHNGETVMIAAHGAINTFLIFAALGLSHEQIFDPAFFNTGITKIEFFEKGTGSFADVHLVYHNIVPHLYKEMPEFNF